MGDLIRLHSEEYRQPLDSFAVVEITIVSLAKLDKIAPGAPTWQSLTLALEERDELLTRVQRLEREGASLREANSRLRAELAALRGE